MIAAPATTAVEILRFLPQSDRTRLILNALVTSGAPAGMDVWDTHTYRGAAEWLVLWGPGGADRIRAMERQHAAGGRVIALDLAYWQRETKFRVSIDAPHPQAWVMRKDWPATRLLADRIACVSRWHPTGPIVVAGIGRKAHEQYAGENVLAWEAAMIRACRERWPERPLVYRKKRPDCPTPPSVTRFSGGPIEHALLGASLVITWHSNVAVDAIRMGIPVVCRDGAAAAVCPSELPAIPAPLAPDLRDRFLQNLAWFQWTPKEARLLWAWLRELLS